MVNVTRKEHYNLDDFRQVIEILRHPGRAAPGIRSRPTPPSGANLLEEAYEAAEAH